MCFELFGQLLFYSRGLGETQTVWSGGDIISCFPNMAWKPKMRVSESKHWKCSICDMTSHFGWSRSVCTLACVCVE